MNTQEMSFEEAGVYLENGALVVDATEWRKMHKHENVKVCIKDGICTVSASRVNYRIHYSRFGGGCSVDEVSDHELQLKRVNWFSKKRKLIVKDGLVELKQRGHKTYSSNTYTIIS